MKQIMRNCNIRFVNYLNISIKISIKVVPLTIEKSNQIIKELMKFKDFLEFYRVLL